MLQHMKLDHRFSIEAITIVIYIHNQISTETISNKNKNLNTYKKTYQNISWIQGPNIIAKINYIYNGPYWSFFFFFFWIICYKKKVGKPN
jgi:cytochrome c biogenesis factor